MHQEVRLLLVNKMKLPTNTFKKEMLLKEAERKRLIPKSFRVDEDEVIEDISKNEHIPKIEKVIKEQ